MKKVQVPIVGLALMLLVSVALWLGGIGTIKFKCFPFDWLGSTNLDQMAQLGSALNVVSVDSGAVGEFFAGVG